MAHKPERRRRQDRRVHEEPRRRDDRARRHAVAMVLAHARDQLERVMEHARMALGIVERDAARLGHPEIRPRRKQD